MTLFSQAAASGKLTADSAFVADAMWPTIMQATAARWMDTVVDPQVEGHRRRDRQRLQGRSGPRRAAHPDARSTRRRPRRTRTPPARGPTRFLADDQGGVQLQQAGARQHRGSGFEGGQRLVRARSPRARWDPPFGNALWKLKPGEMSGVVTRAASAITSSAVRPTPSRRKFWRDSLARAAARADPGGLLGGARQRRTTSRSTAAPCRTCAPRSTTSTVTRPTIRRSPRYKDGSFTTADFVQWMLRDHRRSVAADQTRLPRSSPHPTASTSGCSRSSPRSSLMLREGERNTSS